MKSTNHRCHDCGKFLPADHGAVAEEVKETPIAEDSETKQQRVAEEQAGIETYHRNHSPMGVGRKAPQQQY